MSLSLAEPIISVYPNLPGLIYCVNLNGTIQSGTLAMARLLQLPNSEALMGANINDYISTATQKIITNNNQRVIDTNNAQIFEEAWELLNQHRFYLSQRTPVYNQNGSVTAILVSATDISPYQKKIQQLQSECKNTELYLKNIIANLAEHVFWEDREGKFLGCNDQQAINVGLTKADDLIGKTIYDIARSLKWEPGMVENLRRNDLTVMENKKVITIEEEITLPDGTAHTYLSKKAPLQDDEGNCIGMIGLAFDITERKFMENQLRKAKEAAEGTNIAKSNFIANISHDLRTPLHTMLGIAELLQIKTHYPEQEELIDGIIQSGQSLLQLVEQILQFSELETKHENIKLETIDLRQLIENIILEYAHKMKNKNIDLLISYCDTTPKLIKSNPSYLRRIICNLLENSIKFTNHGHVLIAVEPVEITKNKATLQIIVEDTGIGIASHEIQHIFERFYRVDPAYSGKHKGSGLGLAIVMQLAERLGGKLSVNSQLHMGTTFRCTLTFLLASHVIDSHELESQFSGAHVLIIDDHMKRRETLSKQIPSKNKLAISSAKAIDLFSSAPSSLNHNLIIIDNDIKAISPEALAHKTQSLSKEQEPPMLVLVSKFQHNKIFNQKNTHFHHILSKPIQPTEISHHLAPTWKKWQEAQQRKLHKPINKKLNILVVEDEPLIQKFTRAILNEFGCQVSIAKNGEEALLQSQQEFDLILMDIGLPDMSGLDVTQLIRNQGSNKTTPVIALTAHVSDEDQERCRRAGINDFLTKPASYADFKNLLIKFGGQTPVDK